MRMGWPQSRSARFRDKKNFLLLPEFEPGTVYVSVIKLNMEKAKDGMLSDETKELLKLWQLKVW
jgi:hypothetical protein